MFLKSLILRGFKTFADLIEIEFSQDARITAIVGPNGCGKSNLLDATRWVLGEDNPRELRVANLSNIIFAGTAARKSLSMAEVSLVFDNSAEKLRIPFTEVGIKRRTFRESESEFFINKNQCRLKDIKDLLLDTGLGEGTYSIITQGQVDAILSSKGEERRAVFEEAAGINKYKTRKLAAEKKLIAAEQNILRISDLKIEISEHLITLEEQAKKARQYLEIQARVKELDIGLSKRLLANILEKRESLLVQLEKLRKESRAQKEAEEKDENELLMLKERLRNLEREIDEIIAKSEEEKDALRDIELDRRFTESELQREEKSLIDLENQKKEIEQRIVSLNQELEVASKGIDLSKLPFCENLNETLNTAKDLIERLSSILLSFGASRSLSLNFGESYEKEEACKLKLEMLQAEQKRIAQDFERIRFAAQAHRSQLETLSARVKAAKSKQESLSSLPQKKQEKENLLQRVQQLEEKIRQEDKSERQSLGAETSLEIALAKLEGEMGTIRDRLYFDYNLSIEDLSSLNYEAQNISRAKKEIEEGKARMRLLEPVNLLAIEEFEREKERLSFIEAQLADLNSARENLAALITELDQKAEQTFLETMQNISVVFSETFSALFEGGEAQISLAPQAPPLETEIEISVRPSGRKWLPLQLLSGGERSLCAIAILFSLLKIRPSPFCFLDEVDAALDDANIGRFTSMLKDFSHQSQIIVITHNKRTMSVADSIYGVTMQEPGVSRVISMKLAETVA